jgi:hypothetical protein
MAVDSVAVSMAVEFSGSVYGSGFSGSVSVSMAVDSVAV